jgi:hypothetical protein
MRARAPLLDDLVGTEQQRGWDGETQGLILLRRVSGPGDKKEEEEEKQRRPHMAARGLLTRGPPRAEPPEAHAKSVPVGKRTALEVQEKVAPRRAGIRRTCRSRSSAASW